MHELNHKISIAIAGSTAHTVSIAKTLASDERFSIAWVLSPTAKPVGRKQLLTKNPLAIWAENQQLPTISVTQRIDQKVKNDINMLNSDIDILLVVDFGYLVPRWLLELPTVAPLNLHPSKLPEWRGSSPGQAVLLSGTGTSAITLLQMDEQLDHGPIIHQLGFAVQPSWTQTEYYQTAFAAVLPTLADLIAAFVAENKDDQKSIAANTQPDQSPTPIARELSKNDSFLPWELLQQLSGQASVTASTTSNFAELETQLPPFLSEVWQYLRNQEKLTKNKDGGQEHLDSAEKKQIRLAEFVARASRALSPWPQLWTMVQTTKGERRLKILSASINDAGLLVLDQVQLEGQQPARWNQVKNVI